MAADTILFDPKMVAEYVREGILALTGPLYDQGVIVITDDLMDSDVNTTVKVPYFSASHTVDEYELTVTGDVDLTPSYATEQEEETVKLARPKRVLTENDVRNLKKKDDPERIIAEDLVVDLKYHWIKKALLSAKANGIQNDISAAAGGNDVWNFTTINESEGLFGAEASDIACLVGHSDQRVKLRGITDTQGRPIFLDASTKDAFPMVLGKPYISVDEADGITLTTGSPKIYHSYWLKKGSIVISANTLAEVMEFEYKYFVEKKIPIHLWIGKVYNYVHAYTKMPRGTKSGAIYTKHH